MNQRILLVEPKTKTSYPPLGLMKIATYHELKGDFVHFVFGMDKAQRDNFWDLIYITSVFTYDFELLIKTIKFYRANTANVNNVMVGGISASLLHEKLKNETGITPHIGLLNQKDDFLDRLSFENNEFSYLKECSPTIDNLPPSYGIFGELSCQYEKILNSSYYFFSTKGCRTGCSFCAVTKLEPVFIDYIPIAPRIKFIADRWGERENLLLLDNNIAASNDYDRIIDEIKDCGFAKGEKLKKTNKNGNTIYKKKTVDFNQGVDARRMDKSKMMKMAEIAIEPLRLAFDNILLSKIYEEKVRLAFDCGITHLSNYMLFNYNDSPIDLYRRFAININILKSYPNGRIFSFPMRFSPVERTDRKHLGPHWTKRELRNVQLIIHATHGIVSHNEKFFMRAFGDSEEQFERLLLYPFNYILNRDHYEYETGSIQQWERDFSALSGGERMEFKQLISGGKLDRIPTTSSAKIRRLLTHYEGEHASVLPKKAKQP